LVSGKFVTASATQNSDLIWALRGGESTFGAVTLISFAFGGIDPITSYNATWAGICPFYSQFIGFSSTETYYYFLVISSPIPIFQMAPFFAPNMTISATQALFKPWFDALSAVGITAAPTFNYYPSFLPA
jgi:hypothetical protein